MKAIFYFADKTSLVFEDIAKVLDADSTNFDYSYDNIIKIFKENVADDLYVGIGTKDNSNAFKVFAYRNVIHFDLIK